jgi:hypothetical protein
MTRTCGGTQITLKGGAGVARYAPRLTFYQWCSRYQPATVKRFYAQSALHLLYAGPAHARVRWSYVNTFRALRLLS